VNGSLRFATTTTPDWPVEKVCSSTRPRWERPRTDSSGQREAGVAPPGATVQATGSGGLFRPRACTHTRDQRHRDRHGPGAGRP
jgi:hypothetical protein